MTRDDLVTAVLTETTCGDACWYAREDICRCKCGGKNHGCLKDGNGERPVRTRRVGKIWYELSAVFGWDGVTPHEVCSHLGLPDRAHLLAERYARDKAEEEGVSRWLGKGGAYWVVKASDSQVNKWEELSAWRGLDMRRWHWGDLVYLVWRRIS